MKKIIGGLLSLLLFLGLLCFPPAGYLQADELTSGLNEPMQNTKSESLNLIERWNNLEALLKELEVESILSVEDSRILSEQAVELQTEVNVLRYSFAELLTLYERSEDSRMAERQAAGSAIEQEAARADRAENLNRILSTTSVIGWILAVAGWLYALAK